MFLVGEVEGDSQKDRYKVKYANGDKVNTATGAGTLQF